MGYLYDWKIWVRSIIMTKILELDDQLANELSVLSQELKAIFDVYRTQSNQPFIRLWLHDQ